MQDLTEFKKYCEVYWDLVRAEHNPTPCTWHLLSDYIRHRNYDAWLAFIARVKWFNCEYEDFDRWWAMWEPRARQFLPKK